MYTCMYYHEIVGRPKKISGFVRFEDAYELNIIKDTGNRKLNIIESGWKGIEYTFIAHN